MGDSTAFPARPYVVAIVAGTWILQAVALFSCKLIPLVDYPNHLARHYLESLHLSGRPMGVWYRIEYGVLPNLGADLVLPGLMLIFHPHVAGKLFLLMMAILVWTGVAALLIQLNRGVAGAVLAACLFLPFGFSSQMFWGFLNYWWGFGLACWCLAHFLWLRDRARLPILGLILHALLVALLFLSHLAPWGIYGIVAGCLTLTDGWLDRRRGRTIIQSLVRGVVFLLPTIPSLILARIYASHGSAVDPNQAARWGTVARKLLMPLMVFRGYSTLADAVVICLWIAALVFMFRFSRPRMNRLAGVCLTLLAMLTLYVVTPWQLGSTSDADSRLLPAMFVLLLAIFGAMGVRNWRIGLAILAAAVGLRLGSVIVAWRQASDRLEARAAVLGLLPPGSRLLPVALLDAPSKDHPEMHLPAMAVIRSPDILVPILFNIPGQQPLVIRTEGWKPELPYQPQLSLDWNEVRRGYDYLWLYNPHHRPTNIPGDFTAIHQDADLSLWRIGPVRSSQD